MDAHRDVSGFLVLSRKANRPRYEQLLQQVQGLGCEPTGRHYGVSGNAIRKWVRAYEAQRTAAPQ